MSNPKMPEWLESPEFCALRDSNRPPSDAQRGVLVEMQSVLKGEVGAISVSNAECRLERESLLKSIQGILSPIKALPHDMLAEIFLQCLPDGPSFDWENRSDVPENAPVLLTRICSSWRALALETPSLWMTLTFFADSYIIPSNPSRCTKAIDLCKTWFSRAKSLPLNYRLHISSTGEREHDELVKLVMTETLLSYFPQFKNLTLDSSDLGIVLELLNDVYADNVSEDEEFKETMSCSILEYLHLGTSSNENGTWDEDEQVHIRIFEHAPRLHHFVRRMAVRKAPILHLPWDQLTYLSVSWCSSFQINKLVRKCPNLRCGAFDIGDYEDEDDVDSDNEVNDQEAFIFDHLDNLLIITNEYPSVDVFKNVMFPSLTTLFLAAQMSWQDVSPPWSAINPFLLQLHNIQRLALLDCFVILPEDLLTLLHSTPNLVELELEINFDHQLLFKKLTITDDTNGKEPLIPHLQILVVDYAWVKPGIEEIPEALSAMVKSRWKGSGVMSTAWPKSLQNVSFFIVTGKHAPILEKISNLLQTCVEDGLELNMYRPQHVYWEYHQAHGVSHWHDSLMARRQLTD
ncbi:hypothetical protein BDQ12DRAFT_715804 [Crucibulum laeve]|uniref:Uncharacterized protein n=1 Tax=Crucibulum laeve TaxID=68775 RepID=A0A5C3LL92_9AGAR|nr:hypothetical protein BDQ12DRAFT_715804 [Crucibulum laeve]